MARNARNLLIPVDGGPVIVEDVQRSLRWETHSDGFDNVQRGLVNPAHIVGTEYLQT